KGRAATGKQAQAEVIEAKRSNQFKGFFRSGDALGAGFIDAGWSGGVQMNSLRRQEAIGRGIDPAGNLFGTEQLRAEPVFEGKRHAGGCLAGADDRDTAHVAEIDYLVADGEPVSLKLDMLGNELFGEYGVYAGPPNSFNVGAKLEIGSAHVVRMLVNKET